MASDGVTPRWRNTAQWARNSVREEGLIRDDIMLAHLYHPGAVTGQHGPRSITGVGEVGAMHFCHLGNGSQGMSHFVKYFDLEQYEDTLRRAVYGDHAAPLFAATLDELARYVFLRDLKLLDAVTVDTAGNQVAVALDRLYPAIDLAETRFCLTGKWIKRITPDTVEFEDGSTASLAAPRWEDVKKLVWW